MTIDEVSERYNIPLEILHEYERWNLCGAVKNAMKVWQYDDSDLERLSLILTLHDIGFTSEEIESYMQLMISAKNTDEERLKLLNKKRCCKLDEIHFKEQQLAHLDYLRYKIQKR